MLTIVTIPKPFAGHVGDIQRNAIESWRALGDDVQIVLVGDESGIAEAARDLCVEHVGGIARNERGTPRLDSAFALTASLARSRLWCFVNGDIVLLDDFAHAVERVSSAFDRFLMVGECRDLPVRARMTASDAGAREQLRKRAMEEGRLRGWAAMDYFVFPRGLFDPIPPFLVGRACFDNWLVWRAREHGNPVVDATRSVVAIHQSHDYSHIAGGLEEAYYGDEARYNERLAGGQEHIYSLHDATHKLYAVGPPIRYLGSIGRARERARLAKARYDVRKQQRKERKMPRVSLRLLAVHARPNSETTLLMDALAADAGVELNVLYGQRGDADVALGHTHWFPRSVRLRGKSRYPINWAIWNSFRGLAPDSMLIVGWDTFATQAAIAWCLARRLPYLLLVDEQNAHGSASLTTWRHALVRAAVRDAAAVLVTDSTTEDLLAANDIDRDRVRRLPSSTDAAASLVRDIARGRRSAQSVGTREKPNLRGRLRQLVVRARV